MGLILPPPPRGADIKGRLRWQVSLLTLPGGDTLYVTSDPVRKEHTIRVPTGKPDPIRWLEVQHEYAHCLLAEQVHHLFSTAYFVRGTPQKILTALAPVHRAATDWYVDAVIYTLWPREGLAEIEEHVRLFLPLLKAKGQRLSPEMSWGFALLFAELVHYKGHKGLIRKVRRAAPEVTALADIFLRHDPGRPSVTALVSLENAILRVAAAGKLRVRLVEDAGLEVLEVVQGA